MERLIVIKTSSMPENDGWNIKVGKGVWEDATLNELLDNGWTIKDYKCCADASHYGGHLHVVVHIIKE